MLLPFGTDSSSISSYFMWLNSATYQNKFFWNILIDVNVILKGKGSERVCLWSKLLSTLAKWFFFSLAVVLMILVPAPARCMRELYSDVCSSRVQLHHNWGNILYIWSMMDPSCAILIHNDKFLYVQSNSPRAITNQVKICLVCMGAKH